MKPRSTLGTALALLLAGGALLWFTMQGRGGARGAAPSDGGRAAHEQPTPTPVDEPVVLDATSPDLSSASPTNAAVEVAPSEERALVDASALSNTGLALQVVDESDAPIPGMTVWYQPLERNRRGRVKAFSGADRLPMHEASAFDSVRTDADGLARLPAAAGDAVHAFAGDTERWGHARITVEMPEPRQVRVLSGASLLVRVVDMSGAPCVDVGVELSPSWGVGWGKTLRTGPDGTARFRRAGEELAEQLDTKTWEVRANVLADPPPRAMIDPANVPNEVQLVVPLWGAVAVSVFDEYGEPLAGGDFCRLSIRPQGREPGVLGPRFDFDAFTLNSQVRNGSAEFPCVALGQQLDLSVGQFVQTHKVVAGPTRVGETVSCEIRLGEDHPVLAFRGVTVGGAPIPRETFELNTWRSSGFTMRTDTEGRGLLHSSGGETIELKRTKTGDLAEVEVEKNLEPGVHDIGDVVFGGGDMLVSGIVVDESGAPLRAELAAGERRPWGIFRTTELGATDGEGRFEFRGKSELDGKLELAAFSKGRAGPAIPFQRGDTGVRVVLFAEGAIEGRLIPLQGMDPGGFRITVMESGQKHWGSSVQTQKNFFGEATGENGSFRVGELLPGEYTLRVIELTGSREHAEVTGLVVRPGETTRDPRLDPLDLRGDHTHTVTLRAESAGELTGTLRYGPAGAPTLGEEIGIFEIGGKHRLVLGGSEPSLDLEVSLAGFRTERREGVSGDIEIVLRRGLPVRLVLDTDAALPEPPRFIQAVLISSRMETQWEWDSSALPFDSRGEALVYAREPGPARIAWWSGEQVAEGPSARGVDLGRAIELEILDVVGEQRFVIALTADEMRKLSNQEK